MSFPFTICKLTINSVPTKMRENLRIENVFSDFASNAKTDSRQQRNNKQNMLSVVMVTNQEILQRKVLFSLR